MTSPDVEQMEADLIKVVFHRSISHAENILVLLRQHEAAGVDHDTSIRTIYKKVQEVKSSGLHVSVVSTTRTGSARAVSSTREE